LPGGTTKQFAGSRPKETLNGTKKKNPLQEERIYQTKNLKKTTN
jgi:hypothetical protein